LRVKGRFVTRDQAIILLGSEAANYDFDKLTPQEIKELLNAKFGGPTGPVKKGEMELNEMNMLKGEFFHYNTKW